MTTLWRPFISHNCPGTRPKHGRAQHGEGGEVLLVAPLLSALFGSSLSGKLRLALEEGALGSCHTMMVLMMGHKYASGRGPAEAPSFTHYPSPFFAIPGAKAGSLLETSRTLRYTSPPPSWREARELSLDQKHLHVARSHFPVSMDLQLGPGWVQGCLQRGGLRER